MKQVHVMNYTSWYYNIMLLLLIPAYYLLPKKHRWAVLFAGSMFFFVQLMQRKLQLFVFFGIAAMSWSAGLFIQKLRNNSGTALRKTVLWAGILLTLLPLLTAKGLLAAGQSRFEWLFVMGQSFFTLQIIAYLTDIYRGKISAQKNYLKYLLFISFFPQLIQGPIPRYEQLSGQLLEGNEYRFENLVGGAQLILWGFFLKYMIADKAAIAATPVFDQYRIYSGGYVWAGGLFYIIQLYADFLSCTTLAQGAAQLFGIRLTDNFRRPLFSESIKELWQKWHMSLGMWLRDYIYIPLGGNRRGRLRKWMNVIFTYAVSGLWHGL